MVTAASRRKQRQRERERRGEIVVRVGVTNEIIATLLALRWLKDHESEDRGEIGQAIGLMLADMASGVE